ncbi:MAG: PCRF domain-containing protein, partial [Actinobacteria bacterium]|nr:PCRF domain-containing protein [Actinomycetota bacterium]
MARPEPAGERAAKSELAGSRLKELAGELSVLEERLAGADRYLGLDKLVSRRAELEVELARPDLWEDAQAARAVSKEFGQVNEDVELLAGLRARLGDLEELVALAIEEDDSSITGEVGEQVAQLAKALDDLDLRSLLSGEYDSLDAVAEIHGGAGGTDAQDWAEMLLRMYLRWAERRGF